MGNDFFDACLMESRIMQIALGSLDYNVLIDKYQEAHGKTDVKKLIATIDDLYRQQSEITNSIEHVQDAQISIAPLECIPLFPAPARSASKKSGRGKSKKSK